MKPIDDDDDNPTLVIKIQAPSGTEVRRLMRQFVDGLEQLGHKGDCEHPITVHPVVERILH